MKLSWFHNSCKQNFYVTKCPKTVLFFQFHITGTVPISFIKVIGNQHLLTLQAFIPLKCAKFTIHIHIKRQNLPGYLVVTMLKLFAEVNFH